MRCRYILFSPHLLILVSVAIAALTVGMARAQPTAPQPPANREEGVVESGPVFYVPNKKGELVLVPALTFDQYDQWWGRKEGTGGSAAPPFAFSSVQVEGRVDGQRAELDVSLKGRLTAEAEGYVRVPLALADTFLKEPATYVGPGRLILEFDEKSGGYVAWMQGKLDSEHSLTLKLVAPVRTLGSERRLRFQLPPYPAQIRLSLDTPSAEVDVGDVRLALPESRGRWTEVETDSSGGLFEMHWRRPRGSVSQAATVLEASCASVVRIERIEGRRRIRGEANLRVFSYGGPITTFDVRLPPGMEYMLTANPSFSVETLTEASDSEGQLVRVKWQGATTSGPIELRLLGEATAADSNARHDAAGFQILNAARQWGHVDFVVDDEYAVEWIDRQNVRRVRELPSTGISAKTVARYDYDRFPFSLGYRVTAQPARVFVEPTYKLFARDKQIELDATLNYTIQGNATALKIDLAGWIVDAVEPSALVSYERGETVSTSPLLLTLKPEAFATSPPIEIRLQAHREIDGPTVSVPLPRLLDSHPSPAIVAVVPADNVELTPRADDILGLVPDPSPPQLTLPNWRQQPWFYRERAGETAAHFVGDHRVRNRLVSVDINNAVSIYPSRVDIVQTLQYRIDYEPLSHLRLLAPRMPLGEKGLTILLGDEVLPYRVAEDATPAPRRKQRTPVIVDLLEPRGDLQTIQLSYSLPLASLKANQNTPFDLLFTVPEANQETTVIGHRATIGGDPSLMIALGEGLWRAELSESNSQATFLTDSWLDPLPLTITLLRDRRPTGGNIIRRGWLQSWLTHEDRRDRAVFRVRAVEPVVRLQLPREAEVDSLLATLDGEPPAVLSVSDDGAVLVGVPEDKTGSEIILELWYRFHGGRPPQGWLSIAMPRVEGRDQADQFFWQLILPRAEHLLGNPERMTPAHHWSWRGFYWERCAIHDQRFLERWIGATSQDREAPVTAATNQYLFSSLGAVDRVGVLTVRRSWLLLLAGGVILLGGLSVISFPLMRRPEVLFGLSVLVVALALRAPELAAFVAQAAVVGLTLVMLGRWLEWALGRRYDQRAIIRASSILTSDSKTTELQYRRGEGSSRGATETIPASLQIPQPKTQA